MREEKKKKELEQQKKKLQSLSVTKQKVDINDMFQKQLPDVSRNLEPSVSRTSRASSADGSTGIQDGGSETGKAGTDLLATGMTVGGGSSEAVEVVTSEVQPNTGTCTYTCMYD